MCTMQNITPIEAGEIAKGVMRVALDDRLLRAASAICHHAEFVPCRRVIAPAGVEIACQLLGPGESPGTVQVRGWWEHSRTGRPVPIEEIAIPIAVAARLEEIAAQQVSTR